MTENRKFSPLKPDHPLVGKTKCPGCDELFKAQDVVTLLTIGPGTDPEARRKCLEGKVYNAVGVPVHWACATGEEINVGVGTVHEISKDNGARV